MANPAFEQVIELVLQTSGDPEVLKLASAIKELNSTAEVSDDAMGEFVRQLDELQKTASASAGLEQLTQRTQRLQQEQGELAAAVDRAGLRLQLQTQVQQEAADALERARAASAQARAEQQQYADSGNKSLLVQRELKAAIKETADAQKVAERAYSQATTALNGATRDYERAATAQEKLDAQLASARSNLQAAQGASERLGKAQADLGRSLDSARQQALANAQALRAAAEAADATARRLAEGDERFRRLAAASRTSAEALQRHRAAASEAAQGQDQVNQSAQRGIGIFDRLRGVLASVGVFLGLREAGQAVVGIARIGDEAERTRIRLEGLYGSQEEASRVFGELRRIADDNGQSFDAITEAAARLKGFGLDPLDGTLQSLIDQNTKLGGSQQQLEGIILAVGQAWSKQKLQGEEILQLVERGVPVWDLLAQATGKNVQELQRLSERGELGRETIQALLQEIGNASEGAAARGLNTLGAQFQLVRNRAQEFLETVANSGVLEFFKTQLAALNAEVKRLASDGTLVQYAKSVSDGVVATAEAVKSAVVFVRDYSGALILLGKAYLAIKFAPFIAGFAASAQGMVAAALQARTLAGAVGGLGARLAAIPSSIKIAIGIVAFDQLITQFARLQDAISQYRETLNDVELFEAGQRQLARDRITLIEQIIQTYGKYADTQIKTQQQLNALGEGDIRLYRQRLEAAERYFVAVQAKAKEANDAAGLSEAQAKIRELREALAEVENAYNGIREARKRAFEDAAAGERAVEQALKDLGVSAQNMGKQFTEEGARVTEAFSLIALSAETTGSQIGEAFNNALSKTQTTAEVERLQNALEEALRRGAISAEQFATLMNAAAERVKGLEDAASKAAGTFKEIEKANAEAMRAILATLEATRSQLAAKADQIGREIAAGLAQGADTTALQAQAKALDAELGKVNENVKATAGQLAQLEGKGKDAGEGLKQGAEIGGAALKQLGEDGKEAAKGVEAANEEVAAGGGFAGVYAEALLRLREEFQGTSQAALDLFLSYQKLAARGGAGSDLLGLLDALARAGEQTRRELAGSRSAAEALAADLGAVARATDAAGLRATDLGARFGGSTDAARAELARLLADIQAVEDSVGSTASGLQFLDGATLDNLKRQAESAAQAISQIEQNTRNAVRELEQLNRQLQDEADRAAGNQRQVLERQLQDQLRRIDELAAAGGQAAQQQAQQARRLAQEEFARRVRELEEQAKREEQAARDSLERERATAAERRKLRAEEEDAFNADLSRASGGGIDVTRRVEIVLRNEQLPGRERVEFTDEQINQLGQQVLARIAQEQRGSFRR